MFIHRFGFLGNCCARLSQFFVTLQTEWLLVDEASLFTISLFLLMRLLIKSFIILITVNETLWSSIECQISSQTHGSICCNWGGCSTRLKCSTVRLFAVRIVLSHSYNTLCHSMSLNLYDTYCIFITDIWSTDHFLMNK